MQAVEKHYLQPLAGSGHGSGSIAKLFQALGASVQDWLHNRAERLRLAQLDERMLSDLGLSRGDVDREYARPFWQPIDAAALDVARRIRSASVRAYPSAFTR